MIYQWILAAIVLCVPAFAGIAATRIFSIGSILGISLFGTVLYYVAHIFPIQPIIVWIVLIMFLCAGLTIVSLHRKKRPNKKRDWVAVTITIFAFILFFIIGSKLLIDRPDGIYTGIINAYGDVGWHTALITELADAKKLPVQDPIFAGTNLTYPFLANFVSAAMVIIGSSLIPSMDIPAMIIIPIIILLLYQFGKLYGGSRSTGIIVMLLFLFGGATFGWIRIVPDFIQSHQSIVDFLTHLPNRDYSGVGGDADGFDFLNPVTSLLLPQRAMLFGLPIVLSVLLLLHPKNIKKKYFAVIAGVLAGTLPLFHAHACIALAAAIIALIVTNPTKKQWIQFFIPAFLLGIPELLFYLHGSAGSGSFFRFEPWWMKGDRNFLLFWIQNTGILLPASIIALFTKVSKTIKGLTLAAIFLFIISNIFLFAPWAWDNFKILVFWLLFALPSVAYLFVHFWKNHLKYTIRIALIIGLMIQVGSGAFDIWKLSLPTATTWQEWDQSAVIFAQYIATYVPTQTAIATASVHNSPAVLAGKVLFLGYPAHVWSHGVLPWDRETDVKEFFGGLSPTINGQIPHYILVGPQELATFSDLTIQPQWRKIAQYGSYSLFRQ